MSLKTAIRNVISRNALAHKWFVGFCARFTVRLIAFQSYLSIEDLRAKRRAANASLNDCGNLEACSTALGSVEGAVTLFLPGIDLGAGAASQFLDLGEKVEVPMRRLDDFLAEKGVDHIDFIKADIEGGELNLLGGAQRLLARCHPRILIEIVDIHCWRFGQTPQDVIQFLTARGFSGKYVSDEGTLVAFDPVNPMNGNYFFEPSS